MQGKTAIYECKKCGENFSHVEGAEKPKCPKCGETKNLEEVAAQG